MIAFLLFGMTGAVAAIAGLMAATRPRLAVGGAAAVSGALTLLLSLAAWTDLGDGKTILDAAGHTALAAAVAATVHAGCASLGVAVARGSVRLPDGARAVAALSAALASAAVTGYTLLGLAILIASLGCDVGAYECPI